MSQIFHKILRRPLNGNTIRSLIHHQNSTQPLISHLVHHPQPTTTNPNLESLSKDKPTQFNRMDVYPSFSSAYFFNPISSAGLPDLKPEEDPELDGSASGSEMMWADSVKKKRKRKMNKHKLKKLKKRLRHCS